jgi:drug/metabolite transporter (DMT)-like permease
LSAEAPPAAAPARSWAAIPLVSLLWGMNWPTLGLALREVPPWTLRAITLGGAGVVLLTLNLLRGRSLRVPRDEWHLVLAFTLLYVVLQNLFISFGQLLAPSGRMAIVTFTMPIWTTLLAALCLRERLTRARVVSVVFCALGLIALAGPAIQTGTHWGWLLALGAAWCWAISMILIKRFPVTASPLAVATWQLVIGGACMSVGMLAFDGSPLDRTISVTAAIATIYNIVSQCISQVIWFDALGRLPAALAALGVLLVPPVAMLGSMLLLREVPTLLDVVGLVLITCASATVQIPWSTAWRKLLRSRAPAT